MAVRDLKPGDFVYLVEEYRVTSIENGVAILNGGEVVTTSTSVDDDEHATLAAIYRAQ